MQASEDKSWEKFIDKAMQEARPAEVSDNFTERVLATLETQQEKPVTIGYKAPISKLTWVVLGVVLGGVLIWTALAGTSTQWDWTSELSTYINISAFFEGVALPTLEYSALYSIGLFALFVILQLVFMKRFFDRRLRLE